MILSELVSNAIKHAFPAEGDRVSRSGDTEGPANQICISLHSAGNRVELIVSDNGVGLPADFDLQNLESLGLRLVDLLTHQLGGTLELDHGTSVFAGGAGTAFKITFTTPEKRS